MQDKPPFIASQQILLLDAGAGNPRRLLSPDSFRQLRLREQLDGSKEVTAESPWKPVSRDQLFLDSGPRRLCLTTDAGIGKTTTLQWAEQQVGRQHPDRLAMYMQLRDLPAQSEQYRTSLAELLMIRSQPSLDRAEAQRIIDSLLQTGRLVLLVDALDQTYSDRSADTKLQGLARFLQLDARFCSATVAGRPYAIDHYWDTLFVEGTWRFAQLTTFTSDQQREYLGPKRFAHLNRLDVEVLAIPRALETIRVVPTAELDDLNTAADIYWRAVDVMLEEGFRNDLVRRTDSTGGFTIEDARRLLAMLAFEMSREDNFAGVDEDDMDFFLEQVWQRHQNHSPWASLERFKDRLRRLGQLNEFLEHAVLDVRDLSQLQWKNRSLQEFFAGLWLARYADEGDLSWIESSIYQPVYESDSVWREDQRGALYWVWRFAAEMPEEGRRWKSWLCSMTPLFRPGDGILRSTEMLYRSWPTMLAYASGRGKAGEIARMAINGYQSEFQEAVVGGERGEQAKGIAVAFLADFQPIPPPEFSAAALRFRMGSPKDEESRESDEMQVDVALESSFDLNRHAMTNAVYELFQPAHRKERNQYSGEDQSPVIFVTWYDAWAFCRWLGDEFRLPTEKEWEFACRAGTTTAFHYGNSLSAEQANFDGNYPYGDTTPKGEYLNRTAVVGSYAPNDWGLYDMHGNVWEWCDSWYSEGLTESDGTSFIGSARVLRGGSWDNGADLCRSACRGLRLPASSDVSIGFRVARARKS